MTQAEMTQLMDEIFDKLRGLRAAGQKEYARTLDNAFANFEWVADMLSKGAEAPLTREQVLLVYALKHLDGVMSHVNGHTSQREPVYGRLADLIVYMCLLWGMLAENEHAAARAGGLPCSP